MYPAFADRTTYEIWSKKKMGLLPIFSRGQCQSMIQDKYIQVTLVITSVVKKQIKHSTYSFVKSLHLFHIVIKGQGVNAPRK